MKISIKGLKSKCRQGWKKYGTEITYMAVLVTVVGIIPDVASAVTAQGLRGAEQAQGFDQLANPLAKGLYFLEHTAGPVLLAGGVGKAAYQHFTEQQNQGYKGAIALGIGGAGCLNATDLMNGVFGTSIGCIFF